ncbi:uncharacterized mitochondrial protein AtMg00810-like [Solanum dulcamara]|uniref:uncharacterized mitochondrial protein AtMg00810-like n=1 Tax=Solanum dulcamara TaxID=45834 RepID=UPI002485107D|nr:uncharacterized mitochondrial protein AtMg00810-like [Solanum dulcamara]
MARKYALELISDTGLSRAKPVNTPLEANIKLTTVEYDELTGATTDPLFKDITGYQRLVGRLLYLTIRRPDISFAVQVLSKFIQQPKLSHWEVTLRLVRFIKCSPGQACPNTTRSVTGYVVKLGDSLISWKSKKQHTLSRSSAKAEYRSMAGAVAEIIWFIVVLKELNVNVTSLVKLHYDSKVAI